LLQEIIDRLFEPSALPFGTPPTEAGLRGLASIKQDRTQKEFQKKSGNEVYYTNSLVLLVKNMQCSELRCQKGFDLIPFHIRSFQAEKPCVMFTDVRSCAGVHQI